MFSPIYLWRDFKDMMLDVNIILRINTEQRESAVNHFKSRFEAAGPRGQRTGRSATLACGFEVWTLESCSARAEFANCRHLPLPLNSH